MGKDMVPCATNSWRAHTARGRATPEQNLVDAPSSGSREGRPPLFLNQKIRERPHPVLTLQLLRYGRVVPICRGSVAPPSRVLARICPGM